MRLLKPSNQQYLVTIPRAIVRAMGWEKGVDIAIKIEGKDRLVLMRKDETDQDIE